MYAQSQLTIIYLLIFQYFILFPIYLVVANLSGVNDHWLLKRRITIILFQALHNEWRSNWRRNSITEKDLGDCVLTSTELVLDNHNQLVDINRFPGENDVSPLHHRDHPFHTKTNSEIFYFYFCKIELRCMHRGKNLCVSTVFQNVPFVTDWRQVAL